MALCVWAAERILHLNICIIHTLPISCLLGDNFMCIVLIQIRGNDRYTSPFAFSERQKKFHIFILKKAVNCTCSYDVLVLLLLLC